MKTERIIIRINSDLKAEFKKRCEIQGKSMSKDVIDYIKWVTKKEE